MTIFLPNNISGFRQSFDETIERILTRDQDETFWTLIVHLVHYLRTHPQIKSLIEGTESSLSTNREILSVQALEAIEDQWQRLSKYHYRHRKYRKRLIQIRNIITGPAGICFTPLLDRIQFSMGEFLSHSHIFRLIENAPYMFRSAIVEIQRSQAIVSYKLAQGTARQILARLYKAKKPSQKGKGKPEYLSKYIPKNINSKSVKTFAWRAEDLPSALYSSKLIELNNRLRIPGNNTMEKKKYLCHQAEIDFSKCWERLCFISDCFTVEGSTPCIERVKGNWAIIRDKVWKEAETRCERESLLGARMAFKQKPSSNTSSTLEAFLKPEHQISKKLTECHIRSLQTHIHSYLCRVEQEEQCNEGDETEFTGTQKANFLIQITKKYWKSHPDATYDETYGHYITACPPGKALGRDRWEQIVRGEKLDPRSKKARGKSQKSRKK